MGTVKKQDLHLGMKVKFEYNSFSGGDIEGKVTRITSHSVGIDRVNYMYTKIYDMEIVND